MTKKGFYYVCPCCGMKTESAEMGARCKHCHTIMELEISTRKAERLPLFNLGDNHNKITNNPE